SVDQASNDASEHCPLRCSEKRKRACSLPRNDQPCWEVGWGSYEARSCEIAPKGIVPNDVRSPGLAFSACLETTDRSRRGRPERQGSRARASPFPDVSRVL